MLHPKNNPARYEAEYTGPAWHNTPEYPSISSNEFARDLVLVDQLIHQIEQLAEQMRPLIRNFEATTPELVAHFHAHSDFEEQARTLLWNLGTYVQCERSIDGQNAEALRVHSFLQKRGARLKSATALAHLFLASAPDDFIGLYLQNPRAQAQAFALAQERKFAETRLSEPEETLLQQMRIHSVDAWGNLYDQISGNLRCLVHGKDLGLAEATGILREGNETDRRSAWHGIQNSWRAHEESCAAILNGIAGWRLQEYQRRSTRRKLHFLDLPLHYSRINRSTLEAMMSAIEEARELGQRAMRAMARGYGKRRMDPWDLLAPAPHAGEPIRRTFKEGLRLLRDAFGAIDGSMADFVDTMEKNRWIEGRVLPAKRQGAYCTHFAKSRTPRVFQTYMGSLSDVRTLAHELGHAYHSWVMRDLPLIQQFYPMTLAETASVFAETAFAESFAQHATPEARVEIAWQNAESVTAFILNIPARFDFEKSFYERRSHAGFVTAQELGDLTEAAWRKWYGDTLSGVERQFWMTKLHFSMSKISFYNFPYSFGCLFSLGIYARRHELGAGFLPMYRDLLRDTGRMTAEDLALKHLGENLDDPAFWRKSLKFVARQVEQFEKLVGQGDDA